MYLDVLNTISNIKVKYLVHEKSQMAQMVLKCAQMNILEISPKLSFLKTLKLLFCFIF